MPPRKPTPKPVRAIALALAEVGWARDAAERRGDDPAAIAWGAIAIRLEVLLRASHRATGLEQTRPPV